MKEKNSRLGTVGGQAVLEGVMMKSKSKMALSVRCTDGEIKTEISECKSVSDKYKFLKWPLLRGIVNFAESMVLSFKTLSRSADMLGMEEEESKLEKWLAEKFGKSLATIAAAIGAVLGVGLSVLLFFYLPALLSDLVLGENPARIVKSVFEGATKLALFIAYVYAVSFMPDIKRTFQYHGAEHKSVFCHEACEELTVENVKKHSRYHPRCGTSFLVVMIIIGILVSTLFINLARPLRVLLKIITLPLSVSLGYEFIRYAGCHENIIIKILAAPGLWIQRITTKEPDDAQIEVAIRSLKAALPDIYTEEAQEEESLADEA